LDFVRTSSTVVLDQWKLAIISIQALVRNDNSAARISSFKKVNWHHDYRKKNRTWCIKVEQDLETGDQYFYDRSSLFDAMPAVWKNMTEEKCRIVFNIIDSFYSDTSTNTSSDT